jgi:heptosyltransferase-2
VAGQNDGRVLVVQTAFLGDIVLTTPLLRALRRAGRGRRVAVLTTESGRQVLEGLPFVDELLSFDKRWTGRGTLSLLRAVRRIRRCRFDAVIAAQRSIRTGLIARAAHAALRVGFAGAPGAWAYDRAVPWSTSRHAVRRYLDLAAPLEIEPDAADPRPEVAVDPAARARVADLLAAEGVPAGIPFACVAPGSARRTKRWLPEGYARVVGHLARLGVVPVLVGTSDELELCRQVAAAAGPRAVVVAGRTSIRDLVALLERAVVFLGNDSGPGHLAAALGRPVVTIFGPTAPEQGRTAHGPLRVVARSDLDCRPCSDRGPRRCPHGHFRCMRELPAERVIEALDDSLDAGERARLQTPAVRPA